MLYFFINVASTYIQLSSTLVCTRYYKFTRTNLPSDVTNNPLVCTLENAIIQVSHFAVFRFYQGIGHDHAKTYEDDLTLTIFLYIYIFKAGK